MDRRTVLRSAGLSLALLGGCSADGRLLPGICEPPVTAVGGAVAVGGQAQVPLELSRDAAVVGPDETLTVSLSNTGSNVLRTESAELYDVQRRTERGWSSIYCVEWGTEWDRGQVPHEPGTGFEWRFAFDGGRLDDPRAGVSDPEPVTAGAYRFVYFGLVEPHLDGGDEGSVEERAVAIPFRVTD